MSHVDAFATTSSYAIDPNWYSDIGAKDHITSNLDKLMIWEKYTSKDQVQVTNSLGLSILHVGHSQFHNPTKNLKLPIVTRNILSVHCFTVNNNVFFEFHHDNFLINDRATRNLLLQGRCEGGLYPLSQASIALSKNSLLSIKPLQEQWHC